LNAGVYNVLSNTTVNGIPWHWRIMQCIHRHSCFYKYFGLMMACIDRNYLPLFKLIEHKIVVFDEVHTHYFILILYLNTTGHRLLRPTGVLIF